MKRPRVDTSQLIIPEAVALIEQHLPALPPTDQATTQIALSPLLLDAVNDERGPATVFAIMARTSILFLVDRNEVEDAIGSADAPPLLPELPPLPFRRIAVETIGLDTWALGPPGTDKPTYLLKAFLISEEHQGREWFVTMLVQDYAADVDRLPIFRVRSDGSMRVLDFDFREDDFQGEQILGFVLGAAEDAPRRWIDVPGDNVLFGLLRNFPLEVAHLINARGVTLDEHAIDRAERRRWQRRNGLTFPTTYVVYIDDHTATIESGRSDRTYTVRWMVRGHWRHFKRGDRTWVRPYIKGPAGAPWRGRPIYVAPRDD